MSEILDGDTWVTRQGRAVVVGSNRWPPPQPRPGQFIARPERVEVTV